MPNKSNYNRLTNQLCEIIILENTTLSLKKGFMSSIHLDKSDAYNTRGFRCFIYFNTASFIDNVTKTNIMRTTLLAVDFH